MNDARPWTKHYQPGVPAEIEMPTTSLVEMCEQAVREAGDAVALEFFGRTTTYRQLGDQIARAAEGLRRLGVGAGDRVGLILPNCPQHVVAFYAVLRLGAIVVEHNPLYTARELRHQFEDHRADVIIAWDSAVEKVADLPRDLGVRRIVAVNLLDEFPTVMRLALGLPVPKLRASRDALHTPAPGAMPWKELLSAPPLAADHPRPTVDDLAVIQYTSGTTGQAKGAKLTHRNLYANARQGEAWMHDAVKGKETLYALLPMFHAFGMTLYLTFGILKQGRIVLFPKFDVDLVLKAWKKSPATVYCAVPPIYQKTAAVAKERGVDISSAKFCISGAMALTDDIVAQWEEVSGGLLVEGYGMTESSPVALGNPFAPTRRTGTIGIPFPSTDMKVVDPEDPDVEVERGEEGELLIRGPQVFEGYWENPEETARMLLPGGWLRTGDVVVQDEDGFTTIVDRLKELIITGGFNVSPSEVERVLRAHDAIADAAVVGRRNAGGGEDVVAVITLEEGATAPTLDEVRAFCKQTLASYKVPRALHVVDDLPRSMLGKVLRRQVREKVLTNG
ncbi:long-chain-fatty-acid--CoA ligase [Tessaracoccus oleiagri]|uniref:Long-chain acyl-CoA synthetase n=1 Tax=Tessaracoccus oleiagri TaxID=686624 RepID=A0A1G9N026_9ACTN|nr:long-chain-fatty-acid--CoA ligase [Tessaracoccus oleiagri]SDL79916.1 long-chain acyl-CoA synthetase [Tessaracoccus oleiagri]